MLSQPRQLSIVICPHCGEAQITIYLDETKRITIGVMHKELLRMMHGVMEQIEAFHEGRLDRDTPMPLKCCDAPRIQ